jgi:hypothetical protein
MKFVNNKNKMGLPEVSQVWDIISTCPLWIFGSLLYKFLIQHDLHALALCVYLFCADTLTNMIKTLRFTSDSRMYTFARRPVRATRCDYLSRKVYTPGTYMSGLPSGHMVSISLFVTVEAFRVYYRQETTYGYEYAVLVFCLFLVGAARYLKQCHTWQQILLGTTMGGLLGIAFQYILPVQHYAL